MKRLLRIDKAIIVEGKYDKIRLENIIDALIITTDGFGIFKDKEKQTLIKTLAEQKGIIILTDSDSAGRVIRMHLKSIVSPDCITQVYLPKIFGREKRKSKKGAEGLLGVEGTKDEIILEAFKKFGITASLTNEKRRLVTKADLYAFSLLGRENSEKARKELLEFLNFPNMSTNSFLDLINSLYSYEQFLEVLKNWRQEQTKK